jgi:hypothetical protein
VIEWSPRTKWSVSANWSLAVPRSPTTFQMSVHSTSLDGTSMVRSTCRPLASSRGEPSACQIGQCAPSQVACRPPEANAHTPVTLYPPSHSTARTRGPGPQASTARGSLPKISCATGTAR